VFVVHSVGCGSVVSACVASNGVVHSTSSVRILVIYSFSFASHLLLVAWKKKKNRIYVNVCLYDALPIEAKGGHRTNEGVVSVKRTVSPFVPLSLRTAPVSRSFGLRSSLWHGGRLQTHYLVPPIKLQ
jgi:hypothetical protein